MLNISVIHFFSLISNVTLQIGNKYFDITETLYRSCFVLDFSLLNAKNPFNRVKMSQEKQDASYTSSNFSFEEKQINHHVVQMIQNLQYRMHQQSSTGFSISQLQRVQSQLIQEIPDSSSEAQQNPVQILQQQKPPQNSQPQDKSYDISHSLTNPIQYNSAFKFNPYEQSEILNQQYPQILSDSLLMEVNGISMIQKKEIQEDLNQLKQQFKLSLESIGLQATKNYLYKAKNSFISMVNQLHLFNLNYKTSLFLLDFESQKGRARTIGARLIGEIRSSDKFLLNKILIGLYIKPAKIQVLLGVNFESIQELRLERYWSKNYYPEHGIEVVTNQNNMKRLKKIVLKGDFIGQKMIQSFKYAQLFSLKTLELRFVKEITDQEIIQIFQFIDEHSPNFRLRLLTSKKQKDELNSARQYMKRIDFIYKSQQPISQWVQYQEFIKNTTGIDKWSSKSNESQLKEEKIQRKDMNGQFKKKPYDQNDQINQYNGIHIINNNTLIEGDLTIGQKGYKAFQQFNFQLNQGNSSHK